MSQPVDSEDLDRDSTRVAVIGMACRFPGANNIDEFWQNLVDGVDSVTRFSRQTVAAIGNQKVTEYVPAGGLLANPEWFDSEYFGYTLREALLLDPQHRVLMECAVEALESAGHDPDRSTETIGIYVGCSESSYAPILRSQRDHLSAVTDWDIRMATAADFLGSKIAYKLGLRGPAVAVQAACATSLVAVHLAVQALLSGDCDIALAGGTSVHVPPKLGRFSVGGLLSTDGTCRTFDASADGVVGGQGACLVVLRRLPEATASGDKVHAIVCGSAVNNDGSDRVGFTAPSVSGQAEVVRAAHLAADVDPRTITYVEAHGTATPVGDPIEVAALTRAFRASTDECGFCCIGSVKTNIGHTDAAAGIAGFVKTVLAIEHGKIPPSLHFTEPNPEIEFDTSPFMVVTELREWHPEGMPRRAGVSSFGLGGTNAHVVLEQRTARSPGDRTSSSQLLVLSARTAMALNTVAARLAAHVSRHTEQELPDVAWTLQTGLREHRYRRCAVVRGRADAVRALSTSDDDRSISDIANPDRPIALMFPGWDGLSEVAPTTSDAQYGGSGRYRQEIERCRRVAATLGVDSSGTHLGEFMRQYGLARMWAGWGVTPESAFGQAEGTLTALAAVRTLPLDVAIKLLGCRARLRAGDSSVVDEIARLVADIRSEAPWVPVAYEHGFVTRTDVSDPMWWAERLTSRVSPDRALSTLLDAPGRILVDLGPDCALTAAARSSARWSPGHLALRGCPARDDDRLLHALGRLWCAGVSVSWEAVHAGQRRLHVPLPAYPFQRQRYLVEPDEPGSTGTTEPTIAQADTLRLDTQQVINGLFGEMLGLREVDPQDSFFDLGGDSLVATRLVVRVRQVFPVEIELRAMYVAPSVAELSALIDERMADNVRSSTSNPSGSRHD
ncbi:MAG: hypothetical protein DLM61_02260 [Pseudonocardiales bacterium]|nr:MAG: hypothetical protein DLM61_02260 [Pseudonocardiales bacterium]